MYLPYPGYNDFSGEDLYLTFGDLASIADNVTLEMDTSRAQLQVKKLGISNIYLGTNSVDSRVLADGSVNNSKLDIDAIITANIQNGAVTEPKLGDNSVSTRTIIPLSVDDSKISSLNVLKLVGLIVNSMIESIAADKITGQIIHSQLADNSVKDNNVEGPISLSKLGSGNLPIQTPSGIIWLNGSGETKYRMIYQNSPVGYGFQIDNGVDGSESINYISFFDNGQIAVGGSTNISSYSQKLVLPDSVVIPGFLYVNILKSATTGHISVDDNLRPSGNNIYDIGSSSLYWNSGYITNMFVNTLDLTGNIYKTEGDLDINAQNNLNLIAGNDISFTGRRINTTDEIRFPSDYLQRKVVLYNGDENNFQYTGFGLSSTTLDYMTKASTDSHVFWSAVSSSSRSELFRIKGTGGAQIKNGNMDLDNGSINVINGEVAINGTGVKFTDTSISGYTPTNLNYYEENIPFVVTLQFDTLLFNIGVAIIRSGKQVILEIDEINITFSGTRTGGITATTAFIPERLRPKRNKVALTTMYPSGTIANCRYIVTPTGNIIIQSQTGGSISATGSIVVNSPCLSWLVTDIPTPP